MTRSIHKLTIVALIFLCACARQEESYTAYLAPFMVSEERTVLLIGDSLTERSDGFGLPERLGPDFNVFYKGVSEADFTDWILHLDEAFEKSTVGANYIFVFLGTNDGYRFLPEVFLRNVENFHAALRERSNALVYYTLVPRTKDGTLAANILRNNAALKSGYPSDNTQLLDLDTLFESQEDYPPLYGFDPIHPTDSGYLVIALEIERVLLGLP